MRNKTFPWVCPKCTTENIGILPIPEKGLQCKDSECGFIYTISMDSEIELMAERDYQAVFGTPSDESPME